MPRSEDWSFPDELQPDPATVGFDLDTVLDAMVALRAEIPEDAFTASILGTERGGNGVVIAEGVVLTIGYLITEAQTIWLTSNRGAAVAGYPLAYDQATGFGLVRALGRLDATPLALGSAASLARGDRIYVVGHGGRRHALAARLADKREFAGYWEYLLEEALFTAPAHPEWSGAAFVGEDGRLVGIGSLLVQEAVDGRTTQANMAVPVDLLEPILESLMSSGTSGLPPKPWLGLYAGESDDRVVVGGVAAGGPAEKAGLQPNDLVLEVAGTRVTTLAAFLRAVWRLGSAGVRVPLKVARDGDVLRVELVSADRNDLLKRPRMH
jgi:S1-C subfamily serine protease